MERSNATIMGLWLCFILAIIAFGFARPKYVIGTHEWAKMCYSGESTSDACIGLLYREGLLIRKQKDDRE